MYNFAESLKEHRLSRGLTLKKKKKATGISNANLSRWENNQTIPNIDFCIQLAQFYGITIDELVGLSDAQNLNTQQHSARLPAKVSEKTIEFADDFAELLDDESFINTAKLYKAIPPHLRGLALGYIVGLLQSNHIDTKSILGY